MQRKWEAQKAFEWDAPAKPRKSRDEKFFVTFPYPYMNGRLHLGHTFSLSKAEVRNERMKMKKKNVFGSLVAVFICFVCMCFSLECGINACKAREYCFHLDSIVPVCQ